jgi:uracil-DNA glycosylase
MWFEQMHPAWQAALAQVKPQLDRLEAELAQLPNLVPEAALVMSAFESDPNLVRVVVVGQDPYPTAGVAVGRAFAIGGGKLPASLRNIFRELVDDIGVGPLEPDPDPDLGGWQRQGVMLLNRHLTTEVGSPGKHFDAGWQQFTDAAMRYLIGIAPFLVLVLWGAQAQQIKTSLASELSAAGDRVQTVESVHPSPLSAYRGFFGSKPFTAINAALEARGQQPINWFL